MSSNSSWFNLGCVVLLSLVVPEPKIPVKYSILLKLLLLTYKCLNGLARETIYLRCLVMLRKHRYAPRAQHQGHLQIPEVKFKSYGEGILASLLLQIGLHCLSNIKLALPLKSYKCKLKILSTETLRRVW